MTFISCCKKAPRTTFFVLRWDFLHICKNNKGFADAAGLRVLETQTNDRIKALIHSGKTREEITEEELWVTLLWSDFVERVLHLYGERAFQQALPHLVTAGFVRRRYAKVAASRKTLREQKRKLETLLLRDEAGKVIWYETIEAARADKAHKGEIVNQWFLVTETLNQAIKALGGGDVPEEEGSGDDLEEGEAPSEEQEDAQQDGTADAANTATEAHTREVGGHQAATARGVNPVPVSRRAAPSPSIEQGSQNCESPASKKPKRPRREGSQNCEAQAFSPAQARTKGGSPQGKIASLPSQNSADKARSFASNTNRNQQESSQNLEESTVGARRLVVDPSIFAQVPYERQAILDLAAIMLDPLPKIDPRAPASWQDLAHEQEQKWQQAADILVSDSYLVLRGLAYQARLTAYMSTPGSPCKWLAWFRERWPNAPIRLWHIAKNATRCGAEMEECNWWPEGCQPADSPDTSEPEMIDLATLAGMDASESAGMEQTLGLSYAGNLRKALSDFGWFVEPRELGTRYHPRGWAVDIWFETGRLLRVYSPEQWALIAEIDSEAPVGTPEFVKQLRRALREGRGAA